MSCGRVQAREAPGGVAQLRLCLPESWVRTVRLAQRLWTLTRPGRRQVRADSRARSTPGGRGVSEGQSASRGPREMNKRPASRSAPRLASPRDAVLPARPPRPTRVLTRNRGPQSPSPAGVRGAPTELMPRTVGRPAPLLQHRPSTRALAPPIVKGPAGGSAYKASAGARAAPSCQSRLAIQRGRAAPSNRRPG